MKCRGCESINVVSILSLGELPLANCLHKFEQLDHYEYKCNLEIMLCTYCSLVQLKDLVDYRVLFDNYFYFSSNSQTMLQSAAMLSGEIIPTLLKDSFVVEIASNDGYLLKNYLEKNIHVLGIEPAKNIANYANDRNIPTWAEYFSSHLAWKIVDNFGQADIIHANNVMAHVPDINDFIKGLKILLKPKGRVIIEVPYLLNLINHCAFDTIYHEHVYYFSVSALNYLFSKSNLIIKEVDDIPIHGGSLRLYVAHDDQEAVSPSVKEKLRLESDNNIFDIKYYKTFTQQIQVMKKELLSLLQTLLSQGKKIAAYGASAKGSTLLNYFGIGKEYINFVVDRSKMKQGYYMSGTQLLIRSTDALVSEEISHALLLTWNFYDEILEQQKEFRARGGKFIIPSTIQVV